VTDEPLLETTNLTKRFGSLVANDGIDFSVSEGSIYGLIGPNGSGKSTFFNTVTGFMKPDEGTVTFDGTDITGWAPHRIAQQGLARTFQIVSPFEDMTVRENLLAVHTPTGLTDRQDRVAEILEFLEIRHLADDEASDMSGGQQKLLELARILMLDPKCILLDEPCAGVNPALEKRILDRIRRLNDDGTTFVIVEHDMGVIEDIADRVTVLSSGQNIIDGTFEEVKNDPRVREAYLGTETETETEATVEAAEAAASSERPAAITEQGNGHDPSETTTGSLVAENIVAGYGAHQVINDVSVASHEGITCILGPNGSGKSTLMKTLNGAVPAWSGTVTLNGEDITKTPPQRITHKGVMTVPQAGGVFSRMTVEENLRIGGTVLETEAEIQDRLEAVTDQFPALEEKMHDETGTLSGGQRMMVSFGRAMMADPDVYLLDEPSAGLAPDLVDDTMELVEQLSESGAEVIFIEQNVRAALQIADYVYILAQGELQFEGHPEDLSDEDELIEVYLGL
jgi:ABC-type branched-subunit amino acid transport system ATPase component